ncbi:hypothetical protein DDO73_17870 [Vibrio cholerae]|nr:hypothetical protein [Vibrio cholerae]
MELDWIVNQNRLSLYVEPNKGELCKLQAFISAHNLKVMKNDNGLTVYSDKPITLGDYLSILNKFDSTDIATKVSTLNAQRWCQNLFDNTLSRINISAMSRFLNNQVDDFTGCLLREQIQKMIELDLSDKVANGDKLIFRPNFHKLKAMYTKSKHEICVTSLPLI